MRSLIYLAALMLGALVITYGLADMMYARAVLHNNAEATIDVERGQFPTRSPTGQFGRNAAFGTSRFSTAAGSSD